jgi:hypothetical protein
MRHRTFCQSRHHRGLNTRASLLTVLSRPAPQGTDPQGPGLNHSRTRRDSEPLRPAACTPWRATACRPEWHTYSIRTPSSRRNAPMLNLPSSALTLHRQATTNFYRRRPVGRLSSGVALVDISSWPCVYCI